MININNLKDNIMMKHIKMNPDQNYIRLEIEEFRKLLDIKNMVASLKEYRDLDQSVFAFMVKDIEKRLFAGVKKYNKKYN